MNAGGAIHGSIHDIAGLLKTFLRQLPDPLLTYRFYDAFVQASHVSDDAVRLKIVLLLLLELPTPNLHTLMFLMALLHDVVSAPGSRMTPSNLAAIFTPNLLRPKDDGARLTSERELSNHTTAVAVRLCHDDDGS